MGVKAADYPDQFINPAADAETEQLANAMMKALTAGTGTDSSGFTGGRAMTLESLEDTLQDVLWGEDHIKLFKSLKTSPLFATVDEFDIRTDYGGEWGTAVSETANPPISTQQINREIGHCKFYRDRREISHVLQQLKTIDPGAEAAAEQAATRKILSSVERDLFTGDDTVFPTRIKGLQPTIIEAAGEYTTDLIYDANGTSVTTQKPFHALSGVVYGQGGILTDVYFHPQCQADIDQALEANQRMAIPVQSAEGTIVHGASQHALNTSHGQMKFTPNIFVRAGWEMQALDSLPATVHVASLSGTPVVTAVAGNAGTILEQDNLPAGDYWVRVAAVNAYGESIASAAQQVTLTAGNAIRISVTRADANASGYRVYLSEVDAATAADCRFHEEVAVTGASQVIELDGTWVTGTTNIFCLNQKPSYNAIDFRQLFPLTRMDLAIVSPVQPFLVQLYGYERIMKPNQHCMIKNVLPSTVFDLGWNPLGV